MNRLLQGDVGSGKTLVALAAMLLAVEAGWQAALMAPTQILAEQHYLNFKKLLEPLEIPIALRTADRTEDTAPLPLFANAKAHAWRGEGALPLLRGRFRTPRRKIRFGGTPNHTRETRMLPGSSLARTRFCTKQADSTTWDSSSSMNSTSSASCSGRA